MEEKNIFNSHSIKMTESKFFPKIRTSNPSPINQIISLSLSTMKIPLDDDGLTFSNFKKNCNKVQKNIKKDGGKTSRTRFISNDSTDKWVKYYPAYLTQEENLKSMASTQRQFLNKKKSEKQKYRGRKEVIQMLENTPYSRYKLMELYSLYNTLLSFSDQDPKKFIQGFEAHLNYQKIIIKTQLLKRHLAESKNLSFECFVKIYKKIQDMVFIQNVVDYVEIIFESSGMKQLKIQDIKQTFSKRCSIQKAIQISQEMFLRLNRGYGGTINISQIYHLCEKDFTFCGKLAQLYYRQIKNKQEMKK